MKDDWGWTDVRMVELIAMFENKMRGILFNPGEFWHSFYALKHSNSIELRLVK